MIEAIHKIQDNFFTFHYVSINTSNVLQVQPIFQTLHSTMFLLIRLNASLGDYMYKTLHSTMFLLIQERL